MAKTYRPYIPEQDLLLAPSLREWLPEDRLAFFVSDLIASADELSRGGATGRSVLCSDRSFGNDIEKGRV